MEDTGQLTENALRPEIDEEQEVFQEFTELEQAEQIKKVGSLGARSAALQNAFEFETSEEQETRAYALSKNARNLLSQLVEGDPLDYRLFTPHDVEHIIEALVILKGPIHKTTKYDYQAGFTTLLQPDGSYNKVAEEVFGSSKDSVVSLFRIFMTKQRRLRPDIKSVDDLMRISNPEYQPSFMLRPEEDVEQERKPIPRPRREGVPIRRRAKTTVAVGPPVEQVDSAEWGLAACAKGVDPELFFSKTDADKEEAKKVCGSCAVRLVCLDYALSKDETWGIWGGLDNKERGKLKRRAH